jgi:large subunit ribosomal protein L14
MLSVESKLISGDNTDIKKFKIIKVLGNSFKRYAKLGEIVKSTIKKRTQKKKIIKKKIYYCLIIALRKNTRRKNGHFICMGRNRALTLNDNSTCKFLGTRVYGPICKEVRKKQYKKIISYSKGTI